MDKKKIYILGFFLIISISVISMFLPRYILYIVAMMCIWSIGALSLNLLLGYTGLLNLGHASILGVGAYTSAIITLKLGASAWLALPVAVAITTGFGVLLGLICLRTKEMHFAVITLMFGIMIYFIFRTWEGLTGGVYGLSNIPRPTPISLPFITIDFKSINVWFIFIIIVLLLIVFFSIKLVNSKIGRVFMCVRDDERLATMMGADVRKYKILSCAIACFIAGIAGWLFVHFLTHIAPESFSFSFSFELLIYTLFGGINSIMGPIFGTFAIRSIYEILNPMQEIRFLISAVIILLVIRFLPEGVYVSLKKKFKTLKENLKK